MTDISSTFVSLRGLLIRLVSRFVPPKDVEDVVQEAFVKAFQAEKSTHIENPRAYLLRAAHNIALDYIKRADSRLLETADISSLELLMEQNSGMDSTYDTSASRQEFGHFCEAVRQLPSQSRRAFVLRKVYGYSQREIAQEMGISEKTVEKHIAYGMRQCTVILSKIRHDKNSTRLPNPNGQRLREFGHE